MYGRKPIVLIIAFILLAFSTPAFSAVIRVKTDGNDANNGSSWALAKATITAAITAAGSGDEVWVKAGTYTENITLTSGIALYGGFAWDEENLTDRNWAANVTTIDGDNADTVVIVAALADSSTRIDGFTITNGSGVYGGGIRCSNGSSPVIEHNIIRNNFSGEGGGIVCLENSSPIIKNNLIFFNESSDVGGGIAIFGADSPKIINNTIVNNYGSNVAGGIGFLDNNQLLIANNIIALNASGDGRGIWTDGGTAVLRYNCVFNEFDDNYVGIAPGDDDISSDPQFVNPGEWGGWIWVVPEGGVNYHLLSTSPCINTGNNADAGDTDLDIDGQPRKNGTVDIGADEVRIIHVDSVKADDNGDGITWATAKKTVQAGINAAIPGEEVWVKTGTYVENIALESGRMLYGGFAGTESVRTDRDWTENETILNGGGVGSVVTTADGAAVTTRIDGFTITNGNANDGAGIFVGANGSLVISNNKIHENTASNYGGGIYISDLASVTIKNNLIVSNTADYGGGICSLESTLLITNNTIVDNTSNQAIGGGFAFAFNTATVANNIISFNNNGGIYSFQAALTLRNNCVYGNTEYDYNNGAGGEPSHDDDINEDPEFMNRLGHDYHLLSTSPCINAGNNADAGDNDLDMDGQPRKNGTVDIGADEFYDITPPTIDSTDPEDEAILVAITATVNATFSEPMKAATITGVTFTLKQGENPIAGVVTYNADTKTATFMPSANLANETLYTAAITIGVEDLAGNPMEAEYSWSFTTTSKVQTPTFSPNGGTFAEEQEVTISCASGGTTVYYKIDDGDWVASGSVILSESCTLWAKATKENWTDSDVASAEFTFRAPVVIRMKTDGDNDNDGSTWELAKATVQAAIDACVPGDEVWVKAGTYTENITLANAVKLYGGFAGTENIRTDRDWTANETTINGGAADTVVIIAASAIASTRINGFIITNGANWVDGGGGIRCLNGSSPVIEHNIIRNNVGGSGGGISCLENSFPIIKNNVIFLNTSSFGGGICSADAGSPADSLQIINNTIVNNNGGDAGGGIAFVGGFQLIANNIIAFNTGGEGGRGIYADGGTVTLRNNCVFNEFDENYAGLAPGDNDFSSDPEFVNRLGGDYHLLSTSPCIDAGKDIYVGVGDLDLDGNTRKVDIPGIGNEGDDIVDIGAYELYDDTPPTGEISINGGATYCTSRNVTLTHSGSDVTSGMYQMRFKDDGSAWTEWVAYAAEGAKAWALTSAGDGEKTVYVQYKDNAGNTTGDIIDTITLDTAAPIDGSISINGGDTYTTSASVTLTLFASDATSGMDQMRFSNNGADWSEWEAYDTSKAYTLPAGDGLKTVYVQYKDKAGNSTDSISDEITLDGTAPTVNSTDPEDEAEGVAITATVNATFSEAMKAATIIGANFILKDSEDNAVAGTVTYNAETKTATFDPTANLKKGGTYTATITTDVQDAAGIPMAANYTWSFATVEPTTHYLYQEDAGSTLSGEGDIYILAEDINCLGNGFIIGADSITIDGDNHTLIGNNTDAMGIFAMNKKDITVKNFGNIAYFSTGINFGFAVATATSGLIQNNTVTYTRWGISISNISADSVALDNNIVNYNGEFGIRIIGSDNVTLTDNTAKYNNVAISFNASSSGNSIQDNTVQGNRLDIEDNGSNTYSGNHLYDNLQSKMLDFTEVDRVKTLNDTIDYDVLTYEADGTDCSYPTSTATISSSPGGALSPTISGNNLSGSFQVTRPGTHSLIFTITDSGGNVTKRNFLFFVNADGENTETYYFHGIRPSHGQPRGTDAGSLLFDAPTSSVMISCGGWVQSSPDELPNYPLSNLSAIDTYNWYNSEQNGSVGFQRYDDYFANVDISIPIPAAPPFTWTGKLSFTDVDWAMDYPHSWYRLALKINGEDPWWITFPDEAHSDQPSYTDLSYQYTTTPAIKSFTNPENIIVLSATASADDFDSAQIVLDGTGDTDIVLDAYKRPFSGYTTTITPTTATLSATGLVGETTINSVNMDITPDTGSIEVAIDTWNTDGTYYKKWTETGAGGVAEAAHQVGNLEPNTNYSVIVDDVKYGVYTSNGVGEIEFNYTGGYSAKTFEVENAPPTVTSTNPTNGATDIAINATVNATFSEPMDAATITDATFTLKHGENPIAGVVSYNVGTKTATFTPSANLANGTQYTATITTDVEDVAGNPMAANYTWSFTVVEPTIHYLYQEDAGSTLSDEGDIYILAEDINCLGNGFIVGAKNITIDGAGFSLTGSDTLDAVSGGPYGIKNIGYTGVTVKNFSNISGFEQGIRFQNATGSTIQDNTITSNRFAGVWNISNSNTISGNTSFSNGNWGIYIVGSSNNISNNQAYNNASNFVLPYTGSNTVETSNLVEGKPVYYFYNASDITLDGIDIGMLWCVSCDNITLRNVTLAANNACSIYFNNTTNSTIDHADISNSVRGIFFDNSSTNNTISNNILNFNMYGIRAAGLSSSNNITDNTIKSNSVGIELVTSSNTLDGNTISDCLTDISDTGANTYTNNQFLHNIQSRMIAFPSSITRTANLNDTINYTDVPTFKADGTAAAYDAGCTMSVLVSPTEPTAPTISSNKISGSFPVTRKGTYSLDFTITDPGNNVTKRNYLFFVGTDGSTSNSFYMSDTSPVHGQPHGADAKAINSTVPVSTSAWKCTEFVLNTLDEVPDYPLAQLSSVFTHFQYKTDEKIDEIDPDPLMGIERFVTSYTNVDAYQSTPVSLTYTTADLTIPDLNWGMDYPNSWYWLTLKFIAILPYVRTTAADPSYAEFSYTYTTTPAVKSTTNTDIKILSATASADDSDSAQIVLDGTGDTDIVLDAYKRPFSGYTTTITPTTATLSATGLVGETTINSVNMDITPDAGSIEVAIDTWNTGGTFYKKWTETGAGGVAEAAHRIGNLEPNTNYSVIVDDVKYGVYTSNGVGEIEFNYTGGYSAKTFEVENAPPTVTSTNPTNGATDIAINATVNATFSEPMDAATITGVSFTLKHGENPIAGVVSYNAGTKTATFTPSANLANGTQYTATITTGVEDVAGNAMAANYIWSFTTINKVATPTFNPNGGTFAEAQTVTISCATGGASIYYTTNGEDPDTEDEDSTLYDSDNKPVISENTTLKAKAFKDGYTESNVATSNAFIFQAVTAIRVTPTGIDLNDGSTWELAKATVQAAIDECVPGDEVWVKAGTYTENIILTDGVALYGGFSGNGNERDWTLNETILDGDNNDSVIRVAESVGSSTRIDGFTITNGDNVLEGAGIYIGDGASLVITNNKIYGNNAANYGGGIYCHESSTPTIKNNLIYDNTADCGGGIYCLDQSVPTIKNNLIYGNSAVNGGGIFSFAFISAYIQNNTIVVNTASGDGGGIYFEEGSVSVVVANNIIAFNTGGGIHKNYVNPGPTLHNNCVFDNTGYDYSGLIPEEYSTDINIDPEFVDKDNHDYHLRITSPCINAGNNDDANADDYDMDGQARMNDTVDIGADEVYQVATPTFSPAAGTYNSTQSVEISCATPGATIYYTTNGDAPTDASTLYEGQVEVSSTKTLKAIAYKTNWATSEVGSAEYTFAIVAPTINPNGGTFAVAQTVTISCATDGATIRYTTNGNDPTESDTVIASGGTVTVSSSLILKAKAWKDNWNTSAVTTAEYIITGTVPAPTFSPDGGTFISPVDVTISCTIDGATIRYTTNGNDPTESDQVIASGDTITIPSSLTLKAKAWKDDWVPSMVKSAVYTINLPAVIHVAPNGLDTNNGFSWATAKRTVQTGIAVAEPNDEIWVKAGTYTGCITLKPYVSIYGGFAGTETDRSSRNRTANITVLDGGGSGSVITAPPGVTSETVVDGFTIRNGNALTGGGIVCNSSAPTISNNTITANTAQHGGGGVYCANSSAVISNNTITSNISKGHGGGGIHCYFSSSATISDNTISGNTAYQGGGIACYNSNPEIINNILTSNTASMNYGGGIHCYYSSPSIRNNVIAKNNAWRGGGINCYYSSVPTVLNNTIAENTASSAGGGIYSLGGTIGSPMPVSNNIIAFNSSGICRAAGVLDLESNCVYGNTSYDYLGLAASDYAGDKLVDPKFVNKAAGNYHIQSTSPCVNAGDDSKAVSSDKDMDQQPRIQSTHVDIGADECSRPTCDLNRDGKDDLVGLTSSGGVYYTTNRTNWTSIPGVSLSSLVIGDFNGDRNDDIAGLDSSGAVYYTTDKTNWTNIPGTFTRLAVGDFNGDGLDDLAGLKSNGSVWYTTDKTNWTNIPGIFTQLAAGDFDGDGLDDLAGLKSNGSVWYTTDMSTWISIPGTLASITIGNIDGNSSKSIIGLDANGTVWYTTNGSTWTQLPQVLSKLYIGDANGDGIDDIIGIKADNTIWYTIDKANWVNIPGILTTLAIGDFNGNGTDDIAGLDTEGSIWTTTNKTTWTQIPGTLSKIYSAR